MTTDFTLRPAGPRAFLAEFDELARVRDYYGEAQRRRTEGLLPEGLEIVPAARTILFDEVDDVTTLARDLRAWRPGAARTVTHRERVIPTVYDGEDLDDVAKAWDMSVEDVIAAHTGMTHEVTFLGFAPGFAYIAGLPDTLRVPRRARPRTRVPAGSVAVAAQFTGVYPREAPGGWQLIGRTEVPMWDASADPAAYLLPGDHVRFTRIPA